MAAVMLIRQKMARERAGAIGAPDGAWYGPEEVR
jgi:hypothetical protein